MPRNIPLLTTHSLFPSWFIIVAFFTWIMSLSQAWLTRLPRHSRRILLLPRHQQSFKAYSASSSGGIEEVALAMNKSPQFVFVGGKGGVGKTTSSSAIALALSDVGYRTLVVSTDPAHSLGDTLDNPLRPGMLTQIHSEPSLWALELDVEQSLQTFKKSVEGFDADKLSRTLGIPRDIIDSFGLMKWWVSLKSFVSQN